MARRRCLVLTHNLSVSELVTMLLDMMSVAGESVRQTSVLPRLAREELLLLSAAPSKEQREGGPRLSSRGCRGSLVRGATLSV